MDEPQPESAPSTAPDKSTYLNVYRTLPKKTVRAKILGKGADGFGYSRACKDCGEPFDCSMTSTRDFCGTACRNAWNRRRMVISEEEAKKKWCHRTMLPQPAKWSHCIGSECMAWRWQIGGDLGHTLGDRGFCGFAGDPR
jgi:hypothetical protein